MHIDKVNWITAHDFGRPKWHSFTPCLSWKGTEHFVPWHCLTKCALGNKLLHQNGWTWYHFSQKRLHALIPVIAFTYYWKYAVLFVLGHPVYKKWKGINVNYWKGNMEFPTSSPSFVVLCTFCICLAKVAICIWWDCCLPVCTTIPGVPKKRNGGFSVPCNLKVSY